VRDARPDPARRARRGVRAVSDTGTRRTDLPAGLRAYPRLDRWLAFHPDGTITVFTGKVEIGQGLHTAFAQIVADELDVDVGLVRVAPVDTAHSPDEGVTSGSRSIEEGGTTLRHVAAEARRALLDRAAARLHATPSELTVADGVIRSPSGASVSYRELASDDLLAREVTGDVPLKATVERRLIGTTVPRLDLAAKVTGAPVFVQDLRLPGMLHGRIARPPSYDAALRAVDGAALEAMPGVRAVVRDGSFLGVIAEREEQAIRALQRARRVASWDERTALPAADPRFLLNEASEELVVRERHDATALGRAAREVKAEYSRPYIAHAAIGPSCAVARLDDGRYTVWSHSQGVHQLRGDLRKVLGVGADAVRVIHMEGAGCYGHNGADDVALDAVLLARAVPGRPVRVQWMRDDEFAWEPYGPAMVVRLAARLDDHGDVVDWRHDGWSNGHGNRPSARSPENVAGVLAAAHLARPFAPSAPPPPRTGSSAAQRNAEPLYDFPNERVVNHHVARTPLRVSALRSLGAHANVFAIESFMDELATVSGSDPVEFRLRHLHETRGRAVIEAVRHRAGWRAGEKGDGRRGRGLGFARYKNAAAYVAVIAEVELDEAIRVTRVWAAVDTGMVVSRDGVVNQAEGGIVQAVSWALKEAVGYDEHRIATRGWAEYPILTFSETPEVEIALIDRPDEPPLGVGEAFAGPVAAAIANAVANAGGLRLRDMPFTRERVLEAMA